MASTSIPLRLDQAPWDPSNNLGEAGGTRVVAFNLPDVGDGDANMNENDAAATAAAANTMAVWRERERRQRTLRVLMMFLLMLLLMDGDESSNSGGRTRNSGGGGLRRRRGKKSSSSTQPAKPLEPDVHQARMQQDTALRNLVHQHRRYRSLISQNSNTNYEQQIIEWATQHADEERDEFAQEAAVVAGGAAASPSKLMESSSSSSLSSTSLSTFSTNRGNSDNSDHTRKVFHYPWNTTGFYRGEWTRTASSQSILPASSSSQQQTQLPPTTQQHELTKKQLQQPQEVQRLDAVSLESRISELLSQSHVETTVEGGDFGVTILPPHLQIVTRDDHNLTSLQWERTTVDASGRIYPPDKAVSVALSTEINQRSDASTPIAAPHVTLTRDSGRVAFQLYSRSVPGMTELSLIEGFIKLYDSNSPGYSTRKDILLRVRGVLLHAIGKASLVSNVDIARTALIIPEAPLHHSAEQQRQQQQQTHERRRRLSLTLQENLDNHTTASIDQIRDEALDLFAASTETNQLPLHSMITSHTALDAGQAEGRKDRMGKVSTDSSLKDLQGQRPNRPNASSISRRTAQVTSSTPTTGQSGPTSASVPQLPRWSNRVIPYPFVRDDADESIRSQRTQVYRKMPPREQLLEANSALCEFQINLDVQPIEWTVGAWRNLLTRRFKEQRQLDPASHNTLEAAVEAAVNDQTTPSLRSRSSHLAQAKLLQDQALVVTLIGTIQSTNCNFTASLNATALRTNWEATTSKAINYSFYMMLVCLTQILALLRQLLHSQSQSAATRVSLLCIGWQTVVDALLCLAHIYLSLAMQPLFTAFASVAFFKLLIFCVIEMKYMAMIIQARNSANGGQPTEVLRRQVAMLHLRFYVALFGTFLLAFYVVDKYRILYALGLYSFWIPQIIFNLYTEAKTPLHPYYIYGMSLSRLVAPIYIFAVPQNFLKEVYPEAPTDPLLCELLVLWVAIQTAILMAQRKYGTRFMIPARFLPPKFDYSRPLPPSMLPPGIADCPKPNIMDDSARHTKSKYGISSTATPSASSSATLETRSLRSSDPSTTSTRQRHATAVTTRNRLRKNRTNQQSDTRSNGTLITETVEEAVPPPDPPQFTLECSICYDNIDVRNRRGYMLAPCDHIFHRECLAQWMDIQMVCPICRTELPAL